MISFYHYDVVIRCDPRELGRRSFVHVKVSNVLVDKLHRKEMAFDGDAARALVIPPKGIKKSPKLAPDRKSCEHRNELLRLVASARILLANNSPL